MHDATSREVPLVGRAPHLAVLVDAVDAARRGRGEVVVVEGAPGAGKSRLLAELRERAVGLDVVAANADPFSASEPFGVLIAALGLPGPVLGGGTDDTDASFVRQRFVHTLLDHVEQRCSQSPTVLLLDDVQWFDAASQLTLSRLAPRVKALPLVVVCALRPAPRSPEAEHLLESLRAASAQSLVLPPLSPEDTVALAGELLGAEVGGELSAALGGAGGNPLFVTQLLAALREDGLLALGNGRADLQTPVIPPGLRVTILRRLATLGPQAVELLRLASVLGRSFDPRDLAAVARRSVTELLPVLDEAVRNDLLVARGDELVFRHDVVREAVYEDIPLPVRRGMHAEFAHVLTAAGAPARRVAPHLLVAAERDDEEVVRQLARAADEVVKADPVAGARYLEKALEVCPRTSALRPDLLLARAKALVLAGKVQQGADVALRALHQPLSAEQDVQFRLWLLRGLTALGRPQQALTYLPQSNHSDVAPALRAEVLAEEARIRAMIFDPERVEPTAREAIALAREAGDRRAEATALSALTLLAVNQGRAGDAERYADASLALIEPEEVFGESYVAALAYNMTGRVEDAERLLIEGVRQQETAGGAALVVHGHQFLASVYFSVGRWDECLAEHEAAVTAARELDSSPRLWVSYGWAASVAVHRDDAAGAAAHLDAAEALAAAGALFGASFLRPIQALRLAAFAPPEETRRALAAEPSLVASAALVGEVELLRVAVDAGMRDVVDATCAHVRAAADRASVTYLAGVARYVESMVARDAQDLERAVDVIRTLPRPLMLANALEDGGAVHAEHGNAGRAIELLDESLRTFQSLAARRDIARVQRKLRDLGVQRQTSARRPASTSGWDSVTPAEQRVLDLVVQGATNAEIAARLFLSKRTVETHVSRLLRKLDVTTRAQLVAVAARGERAPAR